MIEFCLKKFQLQNLVALPWLKAFFIWRKMEGNQLFDWMEGNWIRAILYWSAATTRQAAGQGGFTVSSVRTWAEENLHFAWHLVQTSAPDQKEQPKNTNNKKNSAHTCNSNLSVERFLKLCPDERCEEGPEWKNGNNFHLVFHSQRRSDNTVCEEVLGADLKMIGLRMENKQAGRCTPTFRRQSLPRQSRR